MPRLKIKDVEGALKLFKIGSLKLASQELKIACPYAANKHSSGKDEDPSCIVNAEKQVFHCKACGSKGTLVKLFAQVSEGIDSDAAQLGFQKRFSQLVDRFSSRAYDPRKIEVWHDALMNDDGQILVLCEKKGFTRETLIKYRIGLLGDRFTIPMQNEHGDFIMVKLYSIAPQISNNKKFIKHPESRGMEMIFPVEALDKDDVILVEGEPKAMLLRQMGFNACSSTTGAANWKDEWSPLFRDKNVTLLYDLDQAGDQGSKATARSLYRTAKSVRIATLPPFKNAKHNDVTDWVVECDATAEDIFHVLREAKDFHFSPVSKPRELSPDAKLLDVHARDVFRPSYSDCHVQFDGVISAQYERQHRVPNKWTVDCLEDQGKVCNSCPIKQLNQRAFSIPSYSIDNLHSIGSSQRDVDRFLAKFSGIPNQCIEHRIDVEKFTFLRDVFISQVITGVDENKASEEVLAVLVEPESLPSTGLEYQFRGYPVVSPKDSTGIFYCYEHEPLNSLENFLLTPEQQEACKRYRAEDTTQEAVEEKLDTLYVDMATHVTRIFGRRDLHMAVDLAYHSLLFLKIGSKVFNGWMDIAIIGDSATGKSETTTSLREFFDQGSRVPVPTASRSGIVGGVRKTPMVGKERNAIHWGQLVINDRRLLILEEVSALDEDTLKGLRDSRSSGRVSINKVEGGSTYARTRLMWLGNPRRGRPISMFPFGVLALRTLFTEEADIRRFDLVCILAEDDVDNAEILESMRILPEPETNTLDREALQNILRWAWSRKADQVNILQSTVDRATVISDRLLSQYSARVPLVSKDILFKVLRMATALAARLYSTRDGAVVDVLPCHVDTVASFLDRLYSHPSCNYKEFSKKQAVHRETSDPERVKSLLSGKTSPGTAGRITRTEALVEHLMGAPTSSVSVPTFAVLAGLSEDDAREFVTELLDCQALKISRHNGQYDLTPGFLDLLKSISWEDIAEEKVFDDMEY